MWVTVLGSPAVVTIVVRIVVRRPRRRAAIDGTSSIGKRPYQVRRSPRDLWIHLPHLEYGAVLRNRYTEVTNSKEVSRDLCAYTWLVRSLSKSI